MNARINPRHIDTCWFAGHDWKAVYPGRVCLTCGKAER